ncbi:hypothetical protein [Olleya sp. HaHaR_3_96]|uniref:hypothetical protein n=1 Tax=Olleya sp. HaHaR_3_96 TaxID=2745560 RepID=UPI001C4F6EC9|nr:hypothetical protein [Olleya sp. HaHaR_3_96]QXP61145.1 hypothetical protein H0I26_05810 [Olleya sp. HaHaR_3_96]
MKKTLFTITVLLIAISLSAQNVFNTTGHAILDGNSLKIVTPITVGGWARGVSHYNRSDINTSIGGYGMLGSGETSIHYLYMAHGASPWSSKLGVYIKPNGFTGIGTPSPNTNLEVLSGDNDGSNPPILRLTSNDIDAVNNQLLGEIQFYNGDLDGKHVSSFIRSLAAETYGRKGQLVFGTSGTYITDAVERMRINENGYIGIGTTTPTQKLEVANGSLLIKSGNIYITGVANDAGDLIFQKGTSDQLGRIWTQTSGDSGLYLSSGDNAPDLTIDNTGNVGVGTTIPTQKLEVANGSLLVKNGDIYIKGVANDAGDLIFQKGTSGQLGRIWTQTSGDSGLYLSSGNDVPDLTIDNTGNVGVGTTNTQGFKLGVNGKIVATEVKVAGYSNWPDFVFYNDYKLPTLEEVENHINEKGRLKDIPSAKEVEENGVFLGEINSKLLQKIEELTLYTIQQEKKLKIYKKDFLESKLDVQNSKKTIKNLEIRLSKLEYLINASINN